MSDGSASESGEEEGQDGRMSLLGILSRNPVDDIQKLLESETFAPDGESFWVDKPDVACIAVAAAMAFARPDVMRYLLTDEACCAEVNSFLNFPSFSLFHERTPLGVAMNTKNADCKQQEWQECVWLLVEAGADVDAAAFCGEDEEDEDEEDDYVDQGDVPLEAAVENGLLIGAQVLRAMGATIPSYWPPLADLSRDEEPGAYDVFEFVHRSADWSPLHFLKWLPTWRTLELLRGDADVHERVTGVGTPLEVAQQLSAKHASAALVIQAASPWSPQTHHLWSKVARKHAVGVLLIGHLFAESAFALRDVQAIKDLWPIFVMPHAMSRASD
ncbi:hypothetical protein EMIHUDRAFT_194293 [Emiliania huxleyi CCMP1516]|uniref:Uncharacterized protein n=2 Tax=Emiliania huxleyi TaxID=2903 RepID=A0A0D3L193_EMIH1|nr:hypothetical protein EMIHUDRAFT_194293 [Emiliania huxleyi CCMP1516]EOD41778.1 hypothetical protein EMIHUDRAFT_194293 [Emiliania huxleyi CCMP1516]|eukprot:XP_005794207.1 hypothetical protein EMIHUDRAFT_194293 [Emiliania huxleyi CCMP1516]